MAVCGAAPGCVTSFLTPTGPWFAGACSETAARIAHREHAPFVLAEGVDPKGPELQVRAPIGGGQARIRGRALNDCISDSYISVSDCGCTPVGEFFLWHPGGGLGIGAI